MEEERPVEDLVFVLTGPGESAIKIEMEKFFIETFNALLVKEARWGELGKMVSTALWEL